MPNEHRADPTPPPHHGQGRGGSKKESSSLRVSPALHPPERPSPRRADIADHGLGRETRERRSIKSLLIVHKIRLHGRRGKGMAESFSREKLRHAPQKEGG